VANFLAAGPPGEASEALLMPPLSPQCLGKAAMCEASSFAARAGVACRSAKSTIRLLRSSLSESPKATPPSPEAWEVARRYNWMTLSANHAGFLQTKARVG